MPLPEVFPPGHPALDRAQSNRERVRERRVFANAHKAEERYARQLRAVAHQVGALARFYRKGDPASAHWVIAAMRRYAETLWPWAVAVSERMLVDVQRRDEAAWARLGRQMGQALRKEIREAPTGELMQALLHEQAGYITSLPLDAAHRVHTWTLRGIEGAERPERVAAEIYNTGEVTKSRANLIARTEVARTASTLVQARATFVGSEGYIWRTSDDADVRREHRRLNGKYFRWDDPPVSGSNGERAHAGQIYNCRCVPEPVIPDEVAA
jgi:SPP1 gp7 family putative phage head morphogenesis protein